MCPEDVRLHLSEGDLWDRGLLAGRGGGGGGLILPAWLVALSSVEDEDKVTR